MKVGARKPMVGGVFSSLVGILLLSGCGEKKTEAPPPVVRPVKTVVVGGAGHERRTYPGTVQAANRAELSFRVGGPITEMRAREGEQVSKGQLLARLDPRDYQIALNEAKAAFERAEADFKRIQRLYESNAVPLAELEQSRAQRDVARARLDDAEANLDYTYLRAPFSGEIGERYAEKGEEVQAKQTVMSIHDVSGVEIVVNVPEMDRALMNPERKKEVKATFAFAPGREFDLTLKEFAASADPRTQTYKATLAMAQPEGLNIQPGMTAEVRVRIILDESDAGEAGLVIPAAAVFAGDAGEQYVWVIDPGDQTVHRREVTVGEVTGTASIRVLSGLSTGERIAAAAVHQLREGMKIRPME